VLVARFSRGPRESVTPTRVLHYERGSITNARLTTDGEDQASDISERQRSAPYRGGRAIDARCRGAWPRSTTAVRLEAVRCTSLARRRALTGLTLPPPAVTPTPRLCDARRGMGSSPDVG
jgi:hypothetical protein